ncbi:Csu type fimbrial protein [Pseudomarimonas arenosa]|uniref:Spore coat protein U domain-containing protein n=1 Tax=Pseudomarimonas arenosa TaxID=2774145 RepID=A0AAW3ZGV2_9GAMM|nr:spore coat U domain-containing protein [Pseudomarimonas arenosa]MBD8524660.1 spore coat protein U domain-containing protein [Pseudomarimonas arenosa]
MTKRLSCRWLIAGCGLLPCSVLACSVTSSGVAFGAYNVFDVSPVEVAGAITVDCATPYTVSLSVSLNNGSFAPRRLDSLDDSLDYYLYTDPARTTIWGDGTSGTSTVAGSGSGSPVDHTVYGRIPALQDVKAGSYADTIIVTLEW